MGRWLPKVVHRLHSSACALQNEQSPRGAVRCIHTDRDFLHSCQWAWKPSLTVGAQNQVQPGAWRDGHCARIGLQEDMITKDCVAWG